MRLMKWVLLFTLMIGVVFLTHAQDQTTDAPIAVANIYQTHATSLDNTVTLTLDAQDSVSPKGMIVSYLWEIDDEPISTERYADVMLPVGTYQITLMVTDNYSNIASETVIYTVEPFTFPIPDCTTTAQSSDDLIEAIRQANLYESSTPVICLVEDQVYHFSESYQGGSNAFPDITHSVTIVGNGATIQRDEGSPFFRFFTLSGNYVILTLVDLTLHGGDIGIGRGGAVYIGFGARLRLHDVTLTNNRAENGGAIYNVGRVIITESRLIDNHATQNGGVIYASGGTRAHRSIFADNSANRGGVVYTISNINNRLRDNCFLENSAKAYHVIYSQHVIMAERNWWGTETGATVEMNTDQVWTTPYVKECPNE